MRLMYSTVERIGPDERDPSTFEIKLAPTPGLADPSLRIAADQVDGFLAIVGVASKGDLVGRPIRVTVDDEQGIERISFLTVAKQAEAAAPVAISSTGPTGPPAAARRRPPPPRRRSHKAPTRPPRPETRTPRPETRPACSVDGAADDVAGRDELFELRAGQTRLGPRCRARQQTLDALDRVGWYRPTFDRGAVVDG